MADFKIDRHDLETVDEHTVIAGWLVERIANGDHPETGIDAYLQCLAEEVRRYRAACGNPHRHPIQPATATNCTGGRNGAS